MFRIPSELTGSKSAACPDHNLPVLFARVAGHSAHIRENPLMRRDKGFYVRVGWKPRLWPSRCTLYDIARGWAACRTPRKETTVEIREFEEAFRAAIGRDPMRPALAAPGVSSQVGLQLPTEFLTAANTLASRSGEQPKENSLLRAVAAQWS